MAYEFKKISEVEVMTEVPSDVTVLGLSNGQVVQMSSSGLSSGGGSGGNTEFLVILDRGDHEITVNMSFDEVVERIYSGKVMPCLYAYYSSQGVACEVLMPKINLDLDDSDEPYIHITGNDMYGMVIWLKNQPPYFESPA
jgi:hypothetical protein